MLAVQIISIVVSVLIFIGNGTLSRKQHNFNKQIRIAEDQCLINKDCSKLQEFIVACEKDKKCNKKLNSYKIKKFLKDQNKENNFREEKSKEKDILDESQSN